MMVGGWICPADNPNRIMFARDRNAATGGTKLLQNPYIRPG